MSLDGEMVNLIEETEIRDVRLVGVNGQVERLPEEVEVNFEMGAVNVARREDEIAVRFEHVATFTDTASEDGEAVATIELVHVARFSCDETLELDEQSVGAWVFLNVYFMVYPYVRQALEDTCQRLGLPNVVLGYLKRGARIPETVTMLVNTTTYTATPDEPLPLDGDPEA